MALGEILKQKRLAHGWTMQYVAERTHLMTRVIEALETENFKRIPAPVYGRGFIRQYCALLELDPQPLLDEYDAICAGKTRPAVTRPAVHDLPARPPEPIHTGGRRTLPPDPDAAPRAPSVHKLVEPAEATFTAVPKPEVLPGVAPTRADAVERTPPTEPPDEPPFTLSGDDLPEPPPPPSPRQVDEEPPVSRKKRINVTGRAALADLGSSPLTRPMPLRSATERAIFGPQHPVPDPPSPQLSSLKEAATSLVSGLAALFKRLTLPKVRRMGGGASEPLLSKQAILQMLAVAGALVALTLLVLVFRYVFRLSAEAEPEAPLAAETFEPRPVAPLDAPYFGK